MTGICPLCKTSKSQRHCARQNGAAICTLCCVAKRDESCGVCTYYTAAKQYRAAKHDHRGRNHSAPPAGHFIAEINPEVERTVNDALELVQKGQTNQARPILNGLLREHPLNHTVCYGMGTMHAIEGEHKEAIEWFDKAIAIFPYFTEAHFNRALAYQKQLDVANAIRAYRKVVEVGDPKELEVKRAQSFLDGMAKSIRDTDGVDLDTYLEAKTEFDRAFDLMQRGEWLRALEGFRATVAKNDRNAPSHGNMGLCYAKLGHKAKALVELDRAIALDPKYEPAIVNRVHIKQMEEGHSIDIDNLVHTDFSMERFQREQSRRPS